MSTAVLLSLDEFLARPERDDDLREELIEGELIVSPSAKASHAYVVEQLRAQLALLKERGFAIANHFSCILEPGSMPAPDLAVIRRERWEDAARADDWLRGSPELVIEVSSPSNRKLYRKAAVYLEGGAEEVWVVYPKSRTVTVYTDENTREARSGEMIEFHGIQVAVADLFLKA